ncbi:MAG: peptide chain release factor N(5)-glutamine methyltransferase, partial [Bacteroidota bacterium]
MKDGKMTIDSSAKFIREVLKDHYPLREIEGFTKIILGEVTGLNFTGIILNKDKKLPSSAIAKIQNILESLKKSVPIQYITGKTEFYGLPFKVKPGVLIPRPETEELVEWIIRETENKKELKILDIGTGSGCIAVTLGIKLNKAKIHALDNSDAALEVAKQNARLNQTRVNFFKGDILQKTFDVNPGSFDIIVSNPPYVMESEKDLMEENVLSHEPGSALFVPDKDPLIFYKAIASFALTNLEGKGKIYLEINEQFGPRVADLFKQKGFSDV